MSKTTEQNVKQTIEDEIIDLIRNNWIPGGATYDELMDMTLGGISSAAYRKVFKDMIGDGKIIVRHDAEWPDGDSPVYVLSGCCAATVKKFEKQLLALIAVIAAIVIVGLLVPALRKKH